MENVDSHPSMFHQVGRDFIVGIEDFLLENDGDGDEDNGDHDANEDTIEDANDNGHGDYDPEAMMTGANSSPTAN
eukprot:CAMPEP_0201121986 /NCGR_PEP_ID=MMETSP0850-20130426/5729_1 /ASSEMBLY_ACC=CAM_ASM_000622 /TAXON_ID=183588 /ORGANISM="Pseudo-nitzschia fraudulenta, Strain WWA7" /LENGTH=74 /DNA_ID=CAMNT_0047388563 /DNA_START=461 /DNA_END=685 /DNA_ORIENTATION=-